MRPRRPTRLKEFAYVGRFGYSLRFATLHRAPHFTDEALIAGALMQIQRTGDEDGFALIAYCFMPDHVHLAVEGRTSESDLRRFVRIVKQRVAYLARTQFAIPMIWQSGYYERIVRSHGMESVVWYILNNPVRAGLVERAEEYPFSGGRRA
jgi:putative transposase